MALGAKTFNFGKFFSFYLNNMEGNPNPTDVAHDWWTSMDNDESIGTSMTMNRSILIL